MKYDEALKAWGVSQLTEQLRESGDEVDAETVYTYLEVEQGYGCNCSSYASGHVSINGRSVKGDWLCKEIDKDFFDLERFLKEVCEAANGAVTLD